MIVVDCEQYHRVDYYLTFAMDQQTDESKAAVVGLREDLWNEADLFALWFVVCDFFPRGSAFDLFEV